MKQEHGIRELMFRTEMVRKRYLHPIWGEMGLIAGQPRVLSKLWLKDQITQKELSDACCIEAGTLSRALDRLEDMGYISRNENPGCRRSFLIGLTLEGQQMAGRVREILASLEVNMLKGFSEQEAEVLEDMLERIHRNFL